MDDLHNIMKNDIRELVDALDISVSLLLHYQTMSHANPIAPKVAADNRALVKKMKNKLREENCGLY